MPIRFRDLIAYFKTYGIEAVTGTRHWKLTREGTRPFTIPAHGGGHSEIPDHYVKAACKHFGIPRPY